MKKKFLILAAVAVSGLAAFVASNVNGIEKDANAGYCEASNGDESLYCEGPGSCSGKYKLHKFSCPYQEVNK